MAGRWDRWPKYPASRPLKAVDGIAARSKRGSIGDTWWSKRFVAILESFGMGARLTRGRRYARSGQVMGLEVAAGMATAKVQGSRRTPYVVRLSIESFAEEEWDEAIGVMAKQAVFAARLLAGEMPDEIEEAFAEVELPLFPMSTHDLRTRCSCPDWANPCKHVAATLYILAERFDQDPWAILAWRGRTREQVLERMRELRGATSGSAASVGDTREPLPTPAEDGGDAWYAARGSALDEARRAVAEACGTPTVASATLLDLLGPTGLTADGADLSDWLRAVYEAADGVGPRAG